MLAYRRGRRPMRVIDWLDTRLSRVMSLLLIVVLVSIFAVFYAFNTQRALDEQKIILREDGDKILNAMIDQETSLQEYISSNNPILLNPFQQGRPAYLAAVDDLKQHLTSGPFGNTRVRLSQVEEQVDIWYSTFALAQIQQMQTGNSADPRSQDSIDMGKVLFDHVHTALTQLQQAIDPDLVTYQTQVDTINISLVFIVMASLLIASIALWRILRTLTNKLHIQLEYLTHTTQQLGQGERTARVVPLAYTDLQQVGQSINSMADALEQQRNEIEENLQSLERQYVLVERAQSESRAIFDASSEAFLFVTTSGQVHALNRSFCEFFGLAAHAVIGKPLSEIQRRWEQLLVDAGPFYADLERDLTSPERNYSTTIIQQEPQPRALAVYSTPVHSSTGTYLGRLYVMRDITREREAERLKAEFYSLVSHGLRTPITAIKGYTDVLLSGELGPLSTIQQEWLGFVQSNAQRLVALVNDHLDLSRLQTQRMVLRPVTLDLQHLIHDVIQSLQPHIIMKHQQLVLHLADPPLMIQGEENRVIQILTNLLTFAISHTPDGGQIGWITKRTGSMAHITCTSNAEFIAEDLAAFDRPFFHPSMLPSSEGSVSLLGPSITRSLVELHGGVLEVKSVQGEGSTLTCTLPLSLSVLDPVSV